MLSGCPLPKVSRFYYYSDLIWEGVGVFKMDFLFLGWPLRNL